MPAIKNATFGEIHKTRAYPLASDVVSAPQMFTPMVRVWDSSLNNFAVKAATGGAGEVFAGFAKTFFDSLTKQPKVEASLKIGDTDKSWAANTIVLSRAIQTGTLRIAGYTKVADAAALTAAGNYWIGADGKTINFHADDNGKYVTAVYSYLLLAYEASMIGGIPFEGEIATYKEARVITLIEHGSIWTDLYDTSADWQNTGDIYLGAGVLTKTGNVKINGIVRGVPNEDTPFLYVEFNVL